MSDFGETGSGPLVDAMDIEDYRRRQRERVAQWVSDDVLRHPVFDGSTLYQRVGMARGQDEVDAVIAKYVAGMRRLPDLTRGEQELLALLEART